MTNLSFLQFVPVDTIICFRASCPLVIAVIEYLYLDRELPSVRSWLSLLGEVLPPASLRLLYQAPKVGLRWVSDRI